MIFTKRADLQPVKKIFTRTLHLPFHSKFQRLHNGPSTREVNLVDTKPLLRITVPNTCVNIVIVQHRAKARIIVNTLATRSVHPAMRFQNSRSAALGALLTGLIYETTSRTGRPADLDLVLLAGGGPAVVVAAALADGEEQVMVVAVLGNKGSFLCVLTLGLEGNVGACSTAGHLEWRVVHVHGEEIAPEGAKGHDELRAVPIESAVNGVVVLSGAG